MYGLKFSFFFFLQNIDFFKCLHIFMKKKLFQSSSSCNCKCLTCFAQSGISIGSYRPSSVSNNKMQF